MRWTVKAALEVVKRTGGSFVDSEAEKAVHHKCPGLKVLGAIDFLCKHGYRWYKQGQLVC